MAASASSSDASSDRRRYTVDIRAYLAVMASAMALAFAAGASSLGPAPLQAELDAAARILPNGVVGGGGGGPSAGSGASSSSSSLGPSGGRSAASSSSSSSSSSVRPREGEDEDEEEIVQPRRYRTGHTVELGSRVDAVRRKMKHVNLVPPSYEDLGDGAVRRTSDGAVVDPDDETAEEEEEEEEEEEHLPQGQHLLMDIKNVDGSFLDSEERLSAAMTSVVHQAGLTLLSYHCHSLKPRGVSCAGILLESHISFHTWPDEGVITLDLFTCGASVLLPMVPVVERLFGVPRGAEDGTEEKIKSVWAHELRGFRHPEGRKSHYLDNQSDLAYWVVSPMESDVKEQIVSTETAFQRVDIWDVLDVDDTPSYSDALRAGLKEGDPRWLTNEVCRPERMLFLDGTLQSMSDSEREYHEALVHPAMFAHPSPSRVAVVGGGEGATLREVLKHRTVLEAVMIEIDAELVRIAREHLPYMNDCSDLGEGSASPPNCFDDPRARVVYEDGRRWFIDNFGEGRGHRGGKEGAAAKKEEGKFDVIILDALDPEEDNPVAEGLYTDDAFLTAMYSSLTPEGVILIQVGTAPSIHDPRPDLGTYARREQMFRLLEGHPETAAMLVYEEAHCGFNEPHSFLLVCRSPACRSRWYAREDEVDFAIHDRIVRAEKKKKAEAGGEGGGERESENPLVHYDGSTQRSFQVPPRAWEEVYCRREPTPAECDYRGLDPDAAVFEYGEGADGKNGSFEIRSVGGGDGEERPAVFAAQDIPRGSYVMPSDLASSLVVRDASLSNVRSNAELLASGTEGGNVIRGFVDYVDRYGHLSAANGSGVSYVEVGATSLMRVSESEDEANVGRWMPAPAAADASEGGGRLPPYSPVYERRMQSFDLFLVTTRDIGKGEEVVKGEGLWG